MDYLNQDHPALRPPSARAYAADELLRRALRQSAVFRLQFDRKRLERLIGKDTLSSLLPNLLANAGGRKSNYDEGEAGLDSHKIPVLESLLSLSPRQWPELPLNYIKSVRLLDDSGRTVLRGGDHNTFILFDLPANERAALLEAYRQRQIPAEVVEAVEVDIDRLQP